MFRRFPFQSSNPILSPNMRSTKKSVTMQTLQKRVERLERDLRELRRTVSKSPVPDDRPWWEQIAGCFENDAAFAEIVRLGRKIRKEDKEGKR